MSYSKNVLGLKVLESVSFIEKGTALTIELYNNEACIRPATSNDTVVGIALEDYTRGVDNLNGEKISVSIIEFSPAIAGVNIEAGNLISVNDSGKFIVSDKNILGVAITNGKLGELFQFVRIFSKEGSGSSGAVNSVNGMDGDVVIEAKNLNANIVGNPALLQSEYNSGIYEAVRDANNKAAAVENELYTKQNKLIADESIEIVDNKINEKVIVLPISVSGASIVEIANATATVIGRLLKLEASLGFSNTLTGRFQLNLIIDNVPSFVLADGLVSVSALNLNNMTMSALVANVSRSSSQMTVMIQIDNISVYSRGMRIIQII